MRPAKGSIGKLYSSGDQWRNEYLFYVQEVLRYEDIPLEVEEKNDKIQNMNDLFSPQVNKDLFYTTVKKVDESL